MGRDASTVGMALAAAYWLLVFVFLVLSLIVGSLAVARAGVSPRGAGRRAAVAVTAVLPAGAAAIFAFDARPGWSLVLSAAAVLLAVWWLHNMAKREG